jgi:hypothetical protein
MLFACYFSTGRWFSLGTRVSSTNKNDHADITEILLKVELNTHIHFRGSPSSPLILSGIRAQSLVVWVVLGGPLFCFYFFEQLYCMSFFDLRFNYV